MRAARWAGPPAYGRVPPLTTSSPNPDLQFAVEQHDQLIVLVPVKWGPRAGGRNADGQAAAGCPVARSCDIPLPVVRPPGGLGKGVVSDYRHLRSPHQKNSSAQRDGSGQRTDRPHLNPLPSKERRACSEIVRQAPRVHICRLAPFDPQQQGQPRGLPLRGGIFDSPASGP